MQHDTTTLQQRFKSDKMNTNAHCDGLHNSSTFKLHFGMEINHQNVRRIGQLLCEVQYVKCIKFDKTGPLTCCKPDT